MSVKDLVVKLVAEKGTEVDPKKTLAEWLDQVDKLYRRVEDWLRELLDEELMKAIKIRREQTGLSEEPLGDYQIDKLVIEIVDKWIVFDPVGRMIMGSLGRVDLFRMGYKLDGYMLLLFAGDQGAFHWHVVKGAVGVRGWLDRKVFEDILEEMLVG